MSGSVSMSKERLAEGEAASKDYQEEAARQQAKGEVMAAKQSATIKAAMAADTATEIASGGTIKGRAGNAAGMAAIKESAVEGARSQAMLKPKEERVTGATIANMEDVNRNMQANPRMIRLADLAMARKCKVMGEGAQ